MYKRIDFTKLGGNPIDQDSFALMQSSYRDAFGALATFIGNNVIISGMIVVGANISNGWLVYNGQLIPFTGGALGDGSIIIQEVGAAAATFEDNSTNVVEFTNQAILGSPATINYSSLTRLSSIQQIWLTSDIKMVDCTAAYIAANFDNTGLGTNERLGWAICNGNNGTKDRRGTFAIAYDDRIVDPGNNIWDILYNTMGAYGGEKKHTLAPNEFTHQHNIARGDSYNGNGDSGTNFVGGGQHGNVQPDAISKFVGNNSGAIDPHENRPPFIVTLFIQKL